jgi:3-oxoacyl-[acyl-carrier protein] reductase
MESGLKNKVAILAGASDGIAFAAARQFAAEGARLAMCSRTEERIQKAAEQIRSEHKAEVVSSAVDVTDFKATEDFVRRVAERYGRIDICLANAGGPPAKGFLALNMDDWRKAVDLNFLSIVNLARTVVPHMQKGGGGRFIAITSTTVKAPVPDLVLSNAVRPAVVGLFKSLAVEFGKDNIAFNNVAPGFTATERLNELANARARAANLSVDEVRGDWSKEIPMARLGRPEEVADAIVWLASDRASYVTGQTIVVDGGRYKGLA